MGRCNHYKKNEVDLGSGRDSEYIIIIENKHKLKWRQT